MAKRYKLVLSLLFIVLVAVAAVVVTGVLDINKRKEHTPAAPSAQTQEANYADFFETNADITLPLLKTTIENVFYSMSQEGEVTFYELADGMLQPLPETGNYEVEAECGSETLPAVIHYVEKGAFTYGCGLFTNELYPDVNLYDYGFFEVANLFKGFGRESDLLLMVDVDKERFYSNEKVFSEIFTLSDDHETKHFLSENQRQVDTEARMRTDYKMFTNDILNQGEPDHVLFFSSRYYLEYDVGGKVDILTSGGSGENIDNNRYATDLASLNFWRMGDGVYYFKKQDEGFALVKLASSDDEPALVESFTGDLAADYIISGSTLLNKVTGDVYNVRTGAKHKIDYSGFRENFEPDLFAASPNGDFCVLRGANTENVAAVSVIDLVTGKQRSYTDDMFGYLAAINVMDNGGVLLSLANGKSATSFYQLIGSM